MTINVERRNAPSGQVVTRWVSKNFLLRRISSSLIFEAQAGIVLRTYRPGIRIQGEKTKDKEVKQREMTESWRKTDSSIVPCHWHCQTQPRVPRLSRNFFSWQNKRSEEHRKHRPLYKNTCWKECPNPGIWSGEEFKKEEYHHVAVSERFDMIQCDLTIQESTSI